MNKEDLVLDKMNMLVEALNEHIVLCPACHLKSILKTILEDDN